MADDPKVQSTDTGTGAQAPAMPQFSMDTADLSTVYTNFCHVTFTPEELILDFGLNTQTPPQPGQPIKLTHQAFDYRIVARRKDYENIRLADMTKMIGDQVKFGPKPAQPATPPPSIEEMRNKFRPVAKQPVPAGRYGARSTAPE